MTTTAPARRSSASTIVSDLRRRIATAHWPPGSLIPSEHRLAQEFGVCRSTIVKVLRELEHDGLLWSRRGKGRFVAGGDGPAPRTAAIGVLLPALADISATTNFRCLAGVRQVLAHTDYHLKIFAFNERAQHRMPDDDVWTGLIGPRQIDGAIIFTREVAERDARQLAQRMPVVWLGHASIAGAITGVRLDYLGGSYDTAAHLIQLGHQRLAVLTITENADQGAGQRDGVRLAMRSLLGHAHQPIVLDATRNDPARARLLVEELLASSHRPTALICGSDELARGALDAIRDRNLRVPDDLSLTGWNDTLTAEEVGVPVTTVQPDYETLGRLGMRRLLALLGQEQPAGELPPVPCRFVPRKSTAAPPTNLPDQ